METTDPGPLRGSDDRGPTPPDRGTETGHTSEASRGKGRTPSARLSAADRRFLSLLGLPSFGLALATTVVTTYLPVFINKLGGPLVTGALIGIEGVMGMTIPLVVGPWSDSLRTHLGGRMPFVLAGAPLAVGALVLMPLVGSLLGLALTLVFFFVGYFIYYEPYRALYPDLVPDEQRGRSQSFQAGWRGVGMGLALVAGGILLGLWRPLPFLGAAAVLAVVTLLLYRRVDESVAERRRVTGGSPREVIAHVWRLVRSVGDLRRLILANSLWELAVAALKTFVVLYVTVGLGRSTGFASLLLGVAAVGILAGTLVSGKLADRFGHRRLMLATLWPYGLAPFAFVFTTSPWLLPAIVVVSFAAGALMTLPYSALMGVMPRDAHGAAAGLYGFSRGAGTLLGPLLGGVAILALEPVLVETRGYAAVFGVSGAAILLSVPLLWRVDRETIDRRER
jgi:MFS family permease